MTITELDQALKAVCPVFGISIGSRADKATWSIQFMEEATPGQRDAAEVVLVTCVVPLEQ